MNQSIAEIKVSYSEKIMMSEAVQIKSSQDAFKVFWDTWDHSQIGYCEHFKIILANRANRVKGVITISQGGVSGTMVDSKMIFAAALKCCACSIFLAHNHPSGGLTPSEADKSLTRKLKEAGKLLDITVLDHLILSPEERYVSFADEGWM